MTKPCPKHGTVNRYPNGRCRLCHSEQRQQRHKTAWNAAIDHFGGQCAYCGQRNRRLLELHHLNNDGAERRKELTGSQRGAYYYVRLKNLGWPNNHKLQVLCGNCHTELTRFGVVTWYEASP